LKIFRTKTRFQKQAQWRLVQLLIFLERAEERGTGEAEIRDVILNGSPIPAKYGKIGKAKVYDFKKNRHNTYYEQKRVEAFYLIKGDKIITVTVYVFYGKWEV
jgi:hypothetical protein